MQLGVVPGGGRPFGGIYQVDTSALNRLSERLYAEERNQLAQREKEAIALEEQYQKAYSKIKPVDQEKLRQMWGVYKQQNIELLRSKNKLKGDAYIKKQAELNQMLADTFAYAQKSIEDKDQLEETQKRRLQNPNLFDPDSYQIDNIRWNTPVDKLHLPAAHPTQRDEKGVAKMIDLRDPNNLMWKNNIQWGDVARKAIGSPIERGADEQFIDPNDKFTTVTRKYKGVNSPVQIATILSATAMGSRNGAAAITEAFGDVMTPENIISIPQAYEEWRKKPEVVAAYGKEGTEFPPSVWNSQTTTAATLKAMQLAMANTPIPFEKARTRKEAVMSQQQANALDRQFKGYQFSVKKIHLWWGLREQSGINVENFADDAYNSDVNVAKTNNGQIPNVDPTKQKIIFGTTMGGDGVMGIDQNGNYTLTDKNDPQNQLVVPAADAKAKIRIARKAAFQPGVAKPKVNTNKNTTPTGTGSWKDRAKKIK